MDALDQTKTTIDAMQQDIAGIYVILARMDKQMGRIDQKLDRLDAVLDRLIKGTS